MQAAAQISPEASVHDIGVNLNASAISSIIPVSANPAKIVCVTGISVQQWAHIKYDRNGFKFLIHQSIPSNDFMIEFHQNGIASPITDSSMPPETIGKVFVAECTIKVLNRNRFILANGIPEAHALDVNPFFHCVLDLLLGIISVEAVNSGPMTSYNWSVWDSTPVIDDAKGDMDNNDKKRKAEKESSDMPHSKKQKSEKDAKDEKDEETESDDEKEKSKKVARRFLFRTGLKRANGKELCAWCHRKGHFTVKWMWLPRVADKPLDTLRAEMNGVTFKLLKKVDADTGLPQCKGDRKGWDQPEDVVFIDFLSGKLNFDVEGNLVKGDAPEYEKTL